MEYLLIVDALKHVQLKLYSIQAYIIICLWCVVPSAPVTDVAITVESPSSVEVSWLPPHPQEWNGLIVNYTVVYKLIGPRNANLSSSTFGEEFAMAFPSLGQLPVNSLDPRVASLPIRHESLTVEELHEYHVYEFSVYLANSAGRSEVSNPILQELPATGNFLILML